MKKVRINNIQINHSSGTNNAPKPATAPSRRNTMGNAPIAIRRPEATARPNRARSTTVGKAGEPGNASRLRKAGFVERVDCGGQAPVGITEGSSTRQDRADELAAHIRNGLDQGLNCFGPATAPSSNQHIAVDSGRNRQKFGGFRGRRCIQNDHLMQLSGMAKEIGEPRSDEEVSCIGGLATARNQTE